MSLSWCLNVIVQRFFPSEFGTDVDHSHAVEPAKSVFETKAKIRRAIEAEGIPYTYVVSSCFAALIIPFLVKPGDEVTIVGDGNVKGKLIRLFNSFYYFRIFF